jgi:hypothetical protein
MIESEVRSISILKAFGSSKNYLETDNLITVNNKIYNFESFSFSSYSSALQRNTRPLWRRPMLRQLAGRSCSHEAALEARMYSELCPGQPLSPPSPT